MTAADITAYITAAVAVISVLVSLMTAASAANKDSFRQLEKVVESLREDNHRLRAENTQLHEQILAVNLRLNEVEDENGRLTIEVAQLRGENQRLLEQLRRAGRSKQ